MNAGMESSEYQSRVAALVLQVDQMLLDVEGIREWLEASGHFDDVVDLDDEEGE